MEWDVFISHASEDKPTLVESLENDLKEDGMKVWYDGSTLRPGDHLDGSIMYGINNSKIGVAFLSQNYFIKDWTKKELAELIKLSLENRIRLVPIYHKISIKEVRKHSKSLENFVFIDSEIGNRAIVEKIRDLLNTDNLNGIPKKAIEKVFRTKEDLIQKIQEFKSFIDLVEFNTELQLTKYFVVSGNKIGMGEGNWIKPYEFFKKFENEKENLHEEIGIFVKDNAKVLIEKMFPDFYSLKKIYLKDYKEEISEIFNKDFNSLISIKDEIKRFNDEFAIRGKQELSKYLIERSSQEALIDLIEFKLSTNLEIKLGKNLERHMIRAIRFFIPTLDDRLKNEQIL